MLLRWSLRSPSEEDSEDSGPRRIHWTAVALPKIQSKLTEPLYIVSWFNSEESLSRTATRRPDYRPVSSLFPTVPTPAPHQSMGGGLCKSQRRSRSTIEYPLLLSHSVEKHTVVCPVLGCPSSHPPRRALPHSLAIVRESLLAIIWRPQVARPSLGSSVRVALRITRLHSQSPCN